MRKPLSYFAVALVLLAFLPRAHAITVTPPPTPAYVGQIWVGFSVDDSTTLRLELKPSGTGSGVLLTNDAAAHFRVTAWKLTGVTLDVDIRFGTEGDTAHLTGQFTSYLVSYNTTMLPHPERVYEGKLPGPLELSCKELSLRVGLWPESEIQSRLKRVQAEMPPTAPN
jgi:hypothetical protein